MKNELFQLYEGFFVLCYLEVCQLPSFCFIKSVASRLDAEFVKTTIEMEKICGMLNWKYLFLTDQTRFCLDTDKWCGFEAEVEIISGLRPEHVSAETKFQGFLRHGILGEVCYSTDISASGNGDVNMVGEEGTEKGEPVQVSREELQLKALKAVKAMKVVNAMIAMKFIKL